MQHAVHAVTVNNGPLCQPALCGRSQASNPKLALPIGSTPAAALVNGKSRTSQQLVLPPLLWPFRLLRTSTSRQDITRPDKQDQKTPLLRTPLQTPLRPAGPVRGPSLASFLSEASALTTPERRRGTAPPRSGHKPTRVHNSQELGGVLSGRLRSPVRNFWFCLDTLATRRCFLRNPSAGARAFPELPRLPIAKRSNARATPNAPKPSFGKAARNAAMCGSADATKTLPAPRVAVHCGSWLGASRSASRLWNVPVSVASPPLAGVLGQRSWGMLPQEDEGAVRPNPEAVAALESTDAHDLHRTCQNACTSIYLATLPCLSSDCARTSGAALRTGAVMARSRRANES